MVFYRRYLEVEWEVRKGNKRSFSKEVMKGSNPKVPQQNNFSDCGVYILQYVESFFEVCIPICVTICFVSCSDQVCAAIIKGSFSFYSYSLDDALETNLYVLTDNNEYFLENKLMANILISGTHGYQIPEALEFSEKLLRKALCCYSAWPLKLPSKSSNLSSKSKPKTWYYKSLFFFP